MTLTVRFSAEATAELDDAVTWYDGQRAGLGDAFADAVEAAVALIADWPFSGARVDGVPAVFEVRRAPVARFPYHLAYVVAGDHLRILAVAHDRRRPNVLGTPSDPLNILA